MGNVASRVGDLLSGVCNKTGFRAIAVSRTKQLLAIYAKAIERMTGLPRLCVSTRSIRCLTTFRRTVFSVGDQILVRKREWPQGGPLSEPGTMVDLGHSVLEVNGSQHRLRNTGWNITVQGQMLSFQQCVQGILHVDDSLLLSCVMCEECMEMGVANMWPKDVGASKEDSGFVVCFLSSVGVCMVVILDSLPSAPMLCLSLD